MKANDPLPKYDYWDEYLDYPLEDWVQEVLNEDTRMGYWEWVKDCINWDNSNG